MEWSILKLNIQGAVFLTFLSKIVETKIVRERLEAVLVLEVVFSAFYVSDDTEFEFIENKIMGFRITGRQIWVEVGVISWACEACGETLNFPG